MPAVDLGRRLRALLDGKYSNESSLVSIVTEFNKFAADESDEQLAELEKELQKIHYDEVDPSNIIQTEVFLTVLHALTSRLSATSIISSWWEPCLRPAFREPRLPPRTVRFAKELVIHALQDVKTQYSNRVGEFRRRLVDLYLLDAHNEGSGDDVLDLASVDQRERDKRRTWKSNLENILIKHGTDRPADLLDEINEYFTTNPSYRLQLLTLLNLYTSQATFPSAAAPILASHPLIASLLLSLQLDNSSTVCTTAVTVLIKLLPSFAVGASDKLKDMVPRMLAILARLICWKGRPPLMPSTPLISGLVEKLSVIEEVAEAAAVIGTLQESRTLNAKPDLEWQRLESTFEAATSSAPPSQQYFTFLYYLFPCNTIRFLRGPTQYLIDKQVPSPYTVDWEEALDEDQIKSRSESILRAHTVHPLLIWSDAQTELANDSHWVQYDVARIVGECTLLDVRNAGLAGRQRDTPLPTLPARRSRRSEEDLSTPRVYATELPPEGKNARASRPIPHPQLKLEDMVAHSFVLQSGGDVDVGGLTPDSARAVFSALPASPSTSDPRAAPQGPNMGGDDRISPHVQQALAKLQRDVLLLRNELNLELWLNRENVKHIGRLYEEKILSKNAEIERQALHNRLREYKKTVARLHEDFTAHQAQATITKEKNTEWNTALQNKLQAMREQKRRWDDQTASLHSENADLKAKLDAQGKLLADATRQVFVLETRIKETAHKIDRLHDYEARIGQLTAAQSVWDADAQKHREQREEIAIIVSNYKKMQLKVESYEAEIEHQKRMADERVFTLDVELDRVRKESKQRQQKPDLNMSGYNAERAALRTANARLKEQVESLRQEMETLQAELELSRDSLARAAS